MTKKVDESDEQRNSLELFERERAKRLEARRAVRAKVAELEESDPRDDLPSWSPEVDQRIESWTLRVLRELPFADAVHLLARSSDERRDVVSAERLKSIAAKRFEPDDAQLFINALELAAYFGNVARWTAATMNQTGASLASLRHVLQPARDRVAKARVAVEGESNESALRRDVLADFEELFDLVRETHPHFRPVWIDDPTSVQTQLAMHAGRIVRGGKRRHPAQAVKLEVSDVRDALVAWVGFNGTSFAPVSKREKGRIAAKLFEAVFGRKFSADDLRNELADMCANDMRFIARRAREESRVPRSNNER